MYLSHHHVPSSDPITNLTYSTRHKNYGEFSAEFATDR